MARTKQNLINYHTSGVTSMPAASDVKYGELVVRHAQEKPELLIRVSETEFASFMASGAVMTAIESATTSSEKGLEGKIESLSGVVSAFSASVVNNYVTYASAGTAIANAETNSVASAKTYTDNAFTSGKTYVDGQISALTTSATESAKTLDGKIEGLSGATSAFSASVVNNYVTYTSAGTAIANAETNSVASAKTYTDNAFTSGKTYVDGQVSAITTSATESAKTLDGKIEGLSGATSAFSASVVANYVTYTSAGTAIANAETNSVASAKTYTDNAFTSGKTYVDGQISALTTNATESAKTLDGKIEALSGATSAFSASVVTMSGSIKSYIDNKLSTVYKYKGTKNTVADLPTENNEVGDTYNVISADTTTHTPEGTNYSWNGTSWDALGGVVDLTDYATKDYVDGQISAATEESKSLDSKIESLSGVVSAFSASVVNNYVTYTSAGTAIANAETNSVASAKTYTDNAFTSGKTYVDGQVSALTTSATESAKTLDGKIEGLSGSTSAFSASVVANYVTYTSAGTAITNAKEAAVASAKSYTDSAFTSGVTYVDSKISALTSDVTESAKTFDGRLDALEAISAKTLSAIQSVVIAENKEAGVSATTENNVVTFDFSGLVIDCGEF